MNDDMIRDAAQAFLDEVDALVNAGHWSKAGTYSIQRVLSDDVRVRVDIGPWVDPPPIRHSPRRSPWFQGAAEDDAEQGGTT